jgi:DNA repair exonuclease SbcCD ATPase subunit
MAEEETKGPSTKERLATITKGFDVFDSEMKIGTRQRREKDEFKISELKNEMKRLDGDLIAEIKRRKEMNKSTQIWFEGQLSTLDKNFHQALTERTVKTTEKLEKLDVRITELDERFEVEKKEILRQIDERGQELARLLEQFKEEFEHDRVLRLQREEKLVKQLGTQEQETNEKFDNQIKMRETRYAAIKTILEQNCKLRDKAEERFQSFFEKEVHQLHNEVRSETEIREREDDEIVEALNRYTMKLQSSLKIINSTNM